MATFFFILFHIIAVIFGFWMLLISIPLHIFYSMNKSNANKLSENIKEQTEVIKTQQEEVKNKNDSTKTETSMADELAKSLLNHNYSKSNPGLSLLKSAI